MKFVYKSILFFFCLALFLFLPKQKQPISLPIQENIYFAHRGLPFLAENSQQGFLQSEALGFSALETDLNITKDNELVLLHDNNLKRLLGINKSIEEINWLEIEKLNIRHNDVITTNTVLKLEDLFIEDYSFKTIYLDIKSSSKIVADSLLSIIETHKAIERFIIADANIFFLAYLKFKNPNIQTVLEGFNKGKEWTYYLIPESFMPNYWASFYNQVDDKHISFLKRKNLLEYKIVYGIDKSNIEEAQRMGLKHLILDYDASIAPLIFSKNSD